MIVPGAVRLSARLAVIGELVVRGQPFADVGTDHGMLPIALVAGGRVPAAIASDLRESPLQRALDNVRRAAPAAPIDLRLGDGLSVLMPGEVATIVLAGMGGPTIRAIVDARRDVVASVRRLVLQPNTDLEGVRAWIAQERWHLLAERMVADSGRFYVVLAVEPRPQAAPVSWSDADLALGPLLRRRPDRAYIRWLLAERARLEGELEHAALRADPTDPALVALARRATLVRDELDAVAHLFAGRTAARTGESDEGGAASGAASD